MENIIYLDDESKSLQNSIKISTEINTNSKNTNDELDNKSKRLNKSYEELIKTFQKISIIGKMLEKIKYYKIIEKLEIGWVKGIIINILTIEEESFQLIDVKSYKMLL